MIPYLARDGRLPGWKPSPTGRWLMNRITARLAKVDHIVCVSHATKRDLLSYVDIPEDRVSVIHNAVFQPMQPAPPETCGDLRTRLGLPAEAPLILHVGRNFYKNRETVLDVAATVRQSRPDVHLVMVGALTPALAAQAARLDLADALHVLPRVAREDMATLYTTASVLLFPSIYEGFGLPVLEAQMCGTPVVCSDAGSLREVAGEGTTFPAHDVDALAEGVLSALQAGSPPLSEGVAIALASRADSGFWMVAHKTIYEENSSRLQPAMDRML
jgi:glycosyltransferase involved in cell wall biosynthesis